MKETTNSAVLSANLQKYYDGLINKIRESPVIDVRSNQRLLGGDYPYEVGQFKEYLTQNHLNNNDDDNFGITIKRSKILAFFKRQQANKCLSVTNCFGINKSIKGGGKIKLIQKGIFWKNKDTLSDFEVANNIFKNRRGNINYYLNFDLSKKISEKRYNSFTERVEKFYSPSQWLIVAHGFALPVDAMIEILENSLYLGNSETIKISFGLKVNNPDPEQLGSFSFYISDSDIENANFYISCGRNAAPADGDCPPEIPCKPGSL